MEFQDAVKSLATLKEYLEEKGRRHNFYYHYSSWESLTKMVDNHSFLLSKGNADMINDRKEADQTSEQSVWEKTYLSSFAFGTVENLAMWGLYGIPWEDAVRIQIPRSEQLTAP